MIDKLFTIFKDHLDEDFEESLDTLLQADYKERCKKEAMWQAVRDLRETLHRAASLRALKDSSYLTEPLLRLFYEDISNPNFEHLYRTPLLAEIKRLHERIEFLNATPNKGQSTGEIF